jgi:hypothetical protein
MHAGVIEQVFPAGKRSAIYVHDDRTRLTGHYTAISITVDQGPEPRGLTRR